MTEHFSQLLGYTETEWLQRKSFERMYNDDVNDSAYIYIDEEFLES